jgi:hypothetical protein
MKTTFKLVKEICDALMAAGHLPKRKGLSEGYNTGWFPPYTKDYLYFKEGYLITYFNYKEDCGYSRSIGLLLDAVKSVRRDLKSEEDIPRFLVETLPETGKGESKDVLTYMLQRHMEGKLDFFDDELWGFDLVELHLRASSNTPSA